MSAKAGQEGYEEFKQVGLPEMPEPEINITPTGDGSVLEQGNFSSPNFVRAKSGWRLDAQGNLEANDGIFRGDLIIGGISRTIDTTGNIQTALDQINAGGGGTLYLKAGTYNRTSSITGYSSTAIVGISPSNTIINFGSTASSLNFVGSSVYSTGTITGISGGVNVTGSGTAWLANASAGQHLFISTRWYKIAAVTGNTTLILSEGYGDNLTFPQNYRIATVKNNILLENIAVTGSTGTGVVFSDARQITIRNISTYSNSIGTTYTNVSEVDANRHTSVSNTSHGISGTNLGLCNWSSVNTPANGGNGMIFNNFQTAALLACSADGNTADGVNATSLIDVAMLIEASSNGGQGIELVATSDNVDVFSGSIRNNTSDGIKLTATATNCHIFGNSITGNGGYGVNIAAASDANNVLTTNNFATNTSGAVNDSGTGTVIRGNPGVTDNTNNAIVTDVQTFNASGTWTMPTGAVTVMVEAWAAGGGGGGAGTTAGSTGGSGGGGAYLLKTFLASGVTSTVAVTVGTGGTGGTGATDGTVGGNSSFGTYLSVYGGGGGSLSNLGVAGAGGGGGGIRSAGATASGATPGNGGSPIGGTSTVLTSSFGGGYGNAGESVHGGGGGAVSSVGGNSFYGGAGGGGTSSAGGTSIFGGNGGAANGADTNGSNGTQPGGGGGGAYNASGTARNGGNGGAGRIIVTTLM